MKLRGKEIVHKAQKNRKKNKNKIETRRIKWSVRRWRQRCWYHLVQVRKNSYLFFKLEKVKSFTNDWSVNRKHIICSDSYYKCDLRAFAQFMCVCVLFFCFQNNSFERKREKIFNLEDFSYTFCLEFVHTIFSIVTYFIKMIYVDKLKKNIHESQFSQVFIAFEICNSITEPIWKPLCCNPNIL